MFVFIRPHLVPFIRWLNSSMLSSIQDDYIIEGDLSNSRRLGNVSKSSYRVFSLVGGEWVLEKHFIIIKFQYCLRLDITKTNPETQSWKKNNDYNPWRFRILKNSITTGQIIFSILHHDTFFFYVNAVFLVMNKALTESQKESSTYYGLFQRCGCPFCENRPRGKCWEQGRRGHPSVTSRHFHLFYLLTSGCRSVGCER